MRRGRVPVAVVGLVVAAGLVAGCGAAEDTGTAKGIRAGADARPGTVPGADGVSPRDARILESGFEDHATWGPGSYVVRYEITNGGKDAAHYFVGFEFLDADGDVLGSTGVTADGLGPGRTKRGDTAPLASEIENGPLKSIADVRVSTVERMPAR
ncbi:FxLYD domain-containing protein [Streptomyces fragilis]|uniref:FxLYD domain-containing protein n=1 Tax=Streptomyces fragilis TaxID=67301 RepID=A0ABV2YK90_9ACTN|nr:FxLYD domain-containing protein [Streptomyces fragilis]